MGSGTSKVAVEGKGGAGDDGAAVVTSKPKQKLGTPSRPESTGAAGGEATRGGGAGGPDEANLHLLGTSKDGLVRVDSMLAQRRAATTEVLADDIGLSIGFLSDVVNHLSTRMENTKRLEDKIAFVQAVLRSKKLKTLIGRHDEWLKLHAKVGDITKGGDVGEEELAAYLLNTYALESNEQEFQATTALKPMRGIKRFQNITRAVFMGNRLAKDNFDVKDVSIGVPAMRTQLRLSSDQVDSVRAMAGKLTTLEYDPIALHEVTNGHSLFVTAWMLMSAHGVFKDCDISADHAREFLLELEAGYRSNPYHNSCHAADVTQTLNVFLVEGLIKRLGLRSEEVFTLLVAAMVHDLGHPGKTNTFSVATRDEYAIVYNDIAVLENFHIAQAYRILAKPDCNVFSSFSKGDSSAARKLIIACVLGTDMSKHFNKLADFKTLVEDIPEEPNDAERSLILTTAVHCADISNPIKPLDLYVKWSVRVMAEFWDQGDAEKENGLPVSAFMDRSKPAVKKCQNGFFDFIVSPQYQEFGKLLPSLAGQFAANLTANKAYWDDEAKEKEAIEQIGKWP